MSAPTKRNECITCDAPRVGSLFCDPCGRAYKRAERKLDCTIAAALQWAAQRGRRFERAKAARARQEGGAMRLHAASVSRFLRGRGFVRSEAIRGGRVTPGFTVMHPRKTFGDFCADTTRLHIWYTTSHAELQYEMLNRIREALLPFFTVEKITHGLILREKPDA